MAQIKIGDKVKAYTPFKSVPYQQLKLQVVTVNLIESDHFGAFYGGKTAKGKQVYFRTGDIQ